MKNKPQNICTATSKDSSPNCSGVRKVVTARIVTSPINAVANRPTETIIKSRLSAKIMYPRISSSLQEIP